MISFREFGNLFHTDGPCMINDLLPKLVLVLETNRSLLNLVCRLRIFPTVIKLKSHGGINP